MATSLNLHFCFEENDFLDYVKNYKKFVREVQGILEVKFS